MKSSNRIKNSVRKIMRALAGLLLASTSTTVIAASDFVIEEIIVSAQRIEENASEVPIAISAFNEGMIEDRVLIGLSDLQIYVPNLNHTTNDLADTNFAIRGIGSLVSVNDGESGVSLHMNEVPLPPGQPPIELYDVQRVEVLRGPQGTLYGRNATGGVINLISNKPNFDGIAGYLDVEYGDYKHVRLRGAINLPVSDSLAFRVAALSLDRDGYTENLAGGQVPGMPDDVDGRDLHSFRISGSWQPIDATTVWALYERFDENDDRMFLNQMICKTGRTPANACEPGELAFEPSNPNGGSGFAFNNTGPNTEPRFYPLGARDATTGLTYDYPRPEITNPRDVHIDFAPDYELKQDLWQFGIVHDFGSVQLDLAGGYQQWTRHHAYDKDFSVGFRINPNALRSDGLWPISFVPDGVDGLSAPGCALDELQAGTFGGCALEPSSRHFIYQDNDEEREHWSVEAKLRTELDGRVNFLLGANYQHSESKTLQKSFSTELESWTDRGQFLYPGFGAREEELAFESYSAFGEVYVDLSERWQMTVGVRYNRDEKKIADRLIQVPVVELNASTAGFFGGRIFGEPTWVRLFPWQFTLEPFFFGAPIRERTARLLELYGALEPVEAAIAAAGTGNIGFTPEGFTSPEYRALLDAIQLVPLIPQLNEERLLNGFPTQLTWEAWSGRLTLDWRPSDDTLIYATYSRGYKPGGFNPGTRLTFGSDGELLQTYDREDVDAFEVGAKARMLDGSLAINVAAFFSDYQDLQLTNLQESSRSDGAINTNIGAEIFGAELDVLWRPWFAPRAQLELGYAWLHTEVTDAAPRIDILNRTQGDPDLVLLNSFGDQETYVVRVDDALPVVDLAIGAGLAIPAEAAPEAQYPNGIPVWFFRGFFDFLGIETSPGIPVDLTGNRLPESPQHSLHLAASYTWDLAGGALTARWDYYWQDAFELRVFGAATDHVDGWDQHNAMLVFESGSGRWAMQAWIRNIENDVHITGGRRSTNSVAVSEPRAYGASVRYNFGAI